MGCTQCAQKSTKQPWRDEFDWHEKIGQGGFGKVYRCTRRADEQEMACKVIKPPDPLTKKFLKTEIQMMQKLSGKHPAFLMIYDWRRIDHGEEGGDEYRLFLELCEGGDLSRRKDRKMEDKHFKVVLEQLASALAYLHSRRIAHLDLKPGNIAFVHKHDLEIKLLDFGLAIRRKEGRQGGRGMRGTRSYMAPEVAQRKGYTEAADMWSVGAIAYEFLTGNYFLSDSHKIHDEKYMIRHVKSLFVGYFPYEKGAKNLIRKLIVMEPSERLTAEEMLDHTYFGGSMCRKRVMKRFEYYARRGDLQDAFHPEMKKYSDGKGTMKGMFKDLHELDYEGFKKFWDEIIGSDDHDGFQIVFDALDSDGDGTVSMQELRDWYAYDFVMNSDERLWDFLEVIDEGKTGEITLQQCLKVLGDRGDHINWEEYFVDNESHDYKEFALLFRLDTSPQIFTELGSEASVWSTFNTLLVDQHSIDSESSSAINTYDRKQSYGE